MPLPPASLPAAPAAQAAPDAAAAPTLAVLAGPAQGAAFGRAQLPAASALHWAGLGGLAGNGNCLGGQPMGGGSTLLQRLWGCCGPSLAALTGWRPAEENAPELRPRQQQQQQGWAAPFVAAKAAHSEQGTSTARMTRFTAQLQQHLQLLGCGASGSGVPLMGHLCSFLAHPPSVLSKPRAPEVSTAQHGVYVEAALRAVAALLRHDHACRAAALRTCGLPGVSYCTCCPDHQSWWALG